jgi:Protein of unknown function (DUF2818)
VPGFQPAIWFLLGVALVAANLPFVVERIAFFKPDPGGFAGFLWRFLELIVLYFAVGGLALALEARQGQIYPQGWEFYAITAFLFVVFAYPGFVYRYLWKRP